MATINTKFSVNDYKTAFKYSTHRVLCQFSIILVLFVVMALCESLLLKEYKMTLMLGCFYLFLIAVVGITFAISYKKGAAVALRGGETDLHLDFNDDNIVINEYTADGNLYNKITWQYCDVKEVILLKQHLLLKVGGYLSVRLSGVDFATIDSLKDHFCRKLPSKRIKNIQMNMEKYRKRNDL